MVTPLTPKPTRKAETLVRATPTIASSREEDDALKEVSLSRYRCANYILETKTKKTKPNLSLTFFIKKIHPQLVKWYENDTGREENAQ